METTELLRALDDWVQEATIDPVTGLPPDAKLNLRIGPASDHLLGHMGAAGKVPSTGARTRGIDLLFSFPDYEDPVEPDAALERLRSALAEDPSLGGRFRNGQVRLGDVRGPVRGEGISEEYPLLLTVRMRVRQHEP